MKMVWALELFFTFLFVATLIGGQMILIIAFQLLLFTQFYMLPLIYLVWMWFDRNTPYRSGRRFEFFRRQFFWKYICSYFPINFHKTAELDPTKNYLFAFHPHGALAVSAFLNFSTEATDVSVKFPGLTMHTAVMEVLFYLPVFRELVMACGACPVSKESINYKLTKLNEGHSVLVAPGGITDTDLVDLDNPYRIKITGRCGFVRESLIAGAPLVPVFSFGESELFHILRPAPNSFFEHFYKFTRRFTHAAPVLVRGDFLVLPMKKKIDVVAGAPLEVPRLLNPTQEEIHYWHGKYVEALKKLFDDNKERFGRPGKDLELF